MKRNLGQVVAGGKMSIDHVQTAIGVCPEMCDQCGAFPADNGVGKTVHLTREQLAKNLERVIDGGYLMRVFDVDAVERGVEITSRRELIHRPDPSEVVLGDTDLLEPISGEVYPEGFNPVKRIQRVTPLRIADVLNRLITTDINIEPLRSESFADLAELVCDLTDGESRVACLTHGLRANARGEIPEAMRERMSRVVQMMMTHVHGKPKINLFVLTIDMARARGKIDDKLNFDSYLETLDMLRPVLEQDHGMRPRVSISVQGYDNEDHALFIGKAEDLYQRLRRALVSQKDWPPKLLNRLISAKERPYVSVGRASVLPGLGHDGNAPVIPDVEAAHDMVDTVPQWVGFMDVLGRVQRRDRDTERMYRKLVEKGKRPGEGDLYWRPCINGDELAGFEDVPLEDLTWNRDGKFTSLLTSTGDKDPGPGGGGGSGSGEGLLPLQKSGDVDN